MDDFEMKRNYVVAPTKLPVVAVADTEALFPVHRIYCIGRNYAAHAREMGSDPSREPPFFFMKPNDAVIKDGDAFPYPSKSNNVHYEMELVVAIGKGGKNIPSTIALDYVFGYACGKISFQKLNV